MKFLIVYLTGEITGNTELTFQHAEPITTALLEKIRVLIRKSNGLSKTRPVVITNLIPMDL